MEIIKEDIPYNLNVIVDIVVSNWATTCLRIMTTCRVYNKGLLSKKYLDEGSLILPSINLKDLAQLLNELKNNSLIKITEK